MSLKEEESEVYTEAPETLGEFLLRHREASGKSLDDISRNTRVSKRYLLAFEEDDLDNYPEAPFDRGFLRNYALEIGLDPEECLDRFDRFKKASMPTQIKDIKKLERAPMPLGPSEPEPGPNPFSKLIGISVVILVLIGASVFFLMKPAGEETAKAPEVEVLPEAGSGASGAEIQRLDTPSLPAPPANVLELEASKTATLVIRVDSLAEQEILLEAGQAKQIEFRNKISIDGKDRSLVKLKLNGDAVAIKDQTAPTVLYSPSKAFP